MGHQFFDLFSRTAIINLPRRTDRRAEICQEFERRDIPLDGERIRFFDAIAPSSPGNFPSIGARGCFLSHLEVLREALDDGVETVLILEDDAHLGKAFVRHHAAVANALSEQDWDIFYAGFVLETPLQSEPPLHRLDASVALQQSHAVAFQGTAIEKTVSYLEAMLERELGSPEGGPMHVDGAYNWLRRAYPEWRTLITVPDIITQRSSVSDITPGSKWRDAVAKGLRLRQIKNFFT